MPKHCEKMHYAQIYLLENAKFHNPIAVFNRWSCYFIWYITRLNTLRWMYKSQGTFPKQDYE